MTSSNHFVQTVLGPVSVDELGITLPHEHLFNDLSSEVAAPSYASTRMLRGQKVSPELAFLLRQDPYCCVDNVSEKPLQDVIEEIRAFANVGGKTIVDATGSASIGRNPERLRQVAEATGLNVVMCTGPYLEKFEHGRIVDAGVDELVEQILGDLDRGAENTDIRAGVIGEVGVSPAFTESEKRSLRAAGLAQAERPHVGLNIHMPGWQRRGHEVIDILVNECGADPSRIALAHSDPSGKDAAYQRSVLDRGVYLEFDMIGLDITFPGEGSSPSVDETVETLVHLVEEGYAKQLLLSHDLFLKQMWTRNGGNGFSFIPSVFTDLLTSRGVDPIVAADLKTKNPARWLTGSA